MTAATGAASTIVFNRRIAWRCTCDEAGVLKDTSLDVERWGGAEAPPVGGQPRAAIWRSAACRLTVWPGFST